MPRQPHVRKRKRKRKTKAFNQRVHAKRRALERYGLHLNRRDLDGMVQDIQSDRAEIVRRVNNRVSLWIVQHKGQDLPVVYDCLRHNIATFLPKEKLVEFQLIVEGRKFEEDV